MGSNQALGTKNPSSNVSTFVMKQKLPARNRWPTSTLLGKKYFIVVLTSLQAECFQA
jgi:hypothetical protein